MSAQTHEGLLVPGPWAARPTADEMQPAGPVGVTDSATAGQEGGHTPTQDGPWPAPGGQVMPGPWSPHRPGQAIEGEVLDRDDQTPPQPAAGTVRAGKGLALTAGRLAVQTAAGHEVLARRAVDAATFAVIREQIQLARVTGDRVELAAWVDRLDAAKEARRARLLALPLLARSVAVAGAGCLVTAGLLLLTLGIAAGLVNPLGIGWGDYWDGVAWSGRAAVTVVTVAVPGTMVAAVGGWLVAACRAGRSSVLLPARLMAPGQRPADDDPITPSIVVTALRDLGYANLRKAIEAMPDHGAGMLGLIVIAGCGVEVDVALPSGTSTEEIQNRRRKLAENLGRHEHEVFITIPADRRRTVRLWIADAGALDEPIGPSPLVVDAGQAADYYTGRAPWGQDLRGDAALVSVKQRHLLITGLSNQGKTAALRALLLWVALDPTVEIWIADLKGVGDWSMFAGIATRLVQGPTDEHVAEAAQMLDDAVTEMERRNGVVQASGSTEGVTRDMARKAGSGLHPLVVLVDEAQVAFMCPAADDAKRPYGGTKANSRYFSAARKLHNQGRAVNVTLWQGTQDPTNDNLPKLVREGAHIRGSLVLGTEAQAKMALGDKAVDGGAAPHKLRQGLDKGTLVVAGDGVELAPGASSVTIRTHFIGGDDAAAVADRIRARRVRGTTRTDIRAQADRDPLADIQTVLGADERERTTVVLSRLMELDRGYYENWDHSRLRAVLVDHDTDTQKSNGHMYVLAGRVRDALRDRDEGAEGTGGR